MTIDPRQIVTLRSSGKANMGTVGDETTPARFRSPVSPPAIERWVLCFIRLHFSGGTGAADCILYRDCRQDATAWNAALYTLRDVGTGADANLLILADELYHWLFEADEALVLTWTNPDPGDMAWGAEVGIAPVSAIRT